MLGIDVQAEIGTFALRAKMPAFDGTTVVIGPNGAGKTTLLKSVLGEIRPDSGEIALGERSLFSGRNRVNVPTEERRIGYVPQRYALFPHMTVAQNVGFGITRAGRKERRDRVMSLLEDLQIAHLAGRKVRALSGGESQRVALARALAIRPEALLLDEPMAALDASTRRKVRHVLAVRLRAIGIPTFIVSHDLDDAEVFAGRVAVLEKGEVVQIGGLEELRSKPATPFVRQFVDLTPAEPPKPVNEIGAY